MSLPNNLKKIIETLSDKTDDIVFEANKDVKNLEERLFILLSEFVSGLDKDKSGNIKPSKANIKKLSTLDSFINNSIVDDKYLKQVNGFTEEIKSLNTLMSEYFTESDLEFKNDKAFTDIAEDAILKPIDSALTQEGLSQAVNTKLKSVITNGVVGNYKASDLVNELRLLVKGSDDKLGLISRHVQQVTTDAANQYVRTYFEVISNDLDVDWYLYEGNAKDTTREFCIHKYGKFFNKKEIEKWPSSNWSGKIPGTNSSNIFIYAGGFGCRHFILPVSESIVPKSDIERISKLVA